MFDILPANEEYFKRLIEFSKEIFALCADHDIKYVVYGSFALFHYTRNTSLKVNDIDMMIEERDFPRLKTLVEKRGYSAVISDDELHIRNGNLLIEVDSWNLGNEGLTGRIETNVVSTYGMNITLVSLDTLELIYAKARDYEYNSDQDKILQKINCLEEYLGRELKY
ncbi:MAG: hypothetical protein ACQESE_04835 [Nanobdellota archaeon]